MLTSQGRTAAALGLALDRAVLMSAASTEIAGFGEQVIAFTEAGGTLTSDAAVVFNVDASAEVVFVGLKNQASGERRAIAAYVDPAITTPNEIQFDAAGQKCVNNAHGMVDGDLIVVFHGEENLPAELTDGGIYEVDNATADDFELVPRGGGAVITFAAAGTGVAARVTPTTAAGATTLTVQAGVAVPV